MKYQVAGPRPAYGTAPGGEVELDAASATVQLNVDAGILVQLGAAGVMLCPACQVEERKRPKKLVDQAELDAHYGDAHRGLVAPEWKEEVE